MNTRKSSRLGAGSSNNPSVNDADQNIHSNRESDQSNNVIEQPNQNFNIYPPILQGNPSFNPGFLNAFPHPNLDYYPPILQGDPCFNPGFLDAFPRPNLDYYPPILQGDPDFNPGFLDAFPHPNLDYYTLILQGDPGFNPGFLDAFPHPNFDNNPPIFQGNPDPNYGITWPFYPQQPPMGSPDSPSFVPGRPPMGLPDSPSFVVRNIIHPPPYIEPHPAPPNPVTERGSLSYTVSEPEPEPSDHPVLQHLPENLDITVSEFQSKQRSGLKEETITKLLKRRRYKYVRHEREREIVSDAQECLICKEYYVDGEIIGKIQCGHEFHAECIKKVLLSINECTICSDIGLNA